MSTDRPAFYDAPSLSKAATELGQKALQKGLIHSFVIRHFADSSQFYIPDEHHSPLTPEQAYMQFKSLLEQATH